MVPNDGLHQYNTPTATGMELIFVSSMPMSSNYGVKILLQSDSSNNNSNCNTKIRNRMLCFHEVNATMIGGFVAPLKITQRKAVLKANNGL